LVLILSASSSGQKAFQRGKTLTFAGAAANFLLSQRRFDPISLRALKKYG